MGQAKLRKLNDPTFGQPQIYTLEIFRSTGGISIAQFLQQPSSYYLLYEIPFAIPRQATQKRTNVKAIADAGVMMSYFVDPVERGRWDKVERVLNQRCNLDVMVDRAGIKEMPGLLPKQFWGWVRQPDGELIKSFGNSEECIVTIASPGDRVEPDQGVKPLPHTPEQLFARAVS